MIQIGMHSRFDQTQLMEYQKAENLLHGKNKKFLVASIIRISQFKPTMNISEVFHQWSEGFSLFLQTADWVLLSLVRCPIPDWL